MFEQFKNFFKRSKTDKNAGQRNLSSQKQVSDESNKKIDIIMQAAIAERRQKDPLIGVKIGAQEFYAQIINVLKNGQGTRVEDVLAIIGSLAGYAAQMSVHLQKDPPKLNWLGAKNGEKYVIGDAINANLCGSQYSFYRVSGAGVEMAGSVELPDIIDIYRRVDESMGCDRFGIPEIDDAHRPRFLPIEFISLMWGEVVRLTEKYTITLDQWSLFFGLLGQRAIIEGKGVINPTLALKLMMECAVPMARIDPRFDIKEVIQHIEQRMLSTK